MDLRQTLQILVEYSDSKTVTPGLLKKLEEELKEKISESIDIPQEIIQIFDAENRRLEEKYDMRIQIRYMDVPDLHKKYFQVVDKMGKVSKKVLPRGLYKRTKILHGDFPKHARP